MTLDGGIARIRRGRNTAESGKKPVMVYDQEVFASYYGEKTVGIKRFEAAKANQDRADILVEVLRCGGISTEDRCVLEPFAADAMAGMFKILMVQHLEDEDGRPVTDLTLERIDGSV